MTKPVPIVIITDPGTKVATVMGIEDHDLILGQLGQSQTFKADIQSRRRYYLTPLIKAQVDICLN